MGTSCHLPLEADESLYSWLVAACILSSHPRYRDTLSAFSIAPECQLASMFPSYIERVSKLTSKSVPHLIQNHTALPIFQSFLRRQTFSAAIMDFSKGNVGSLHSKLSLIANRVSCQPSLVYCPVCASEDIERLGRAFWHVQHQLPGICVCTKHGCSLRHITPSRKMLYLPTIDNVSPDGLPSSVDAKLSQLISDAWQSPVLSCPEALNFSYRKRLHSLDFLSPGMEIRQRLLSNEIRKFWQDCTSKKIQWLLTQSNYPETFMRTGQSNFHPLKHLALICMLWPSWEAFCDSLLSSQSAFNKDVKPTGPDNDTLDQEIVFALKAGESLRQVSLKSKKSVIYVKKVAIQNQITIDRRSQRIFGPDRQAILDMLSVGDKTETIAVFHEVSVGAVEQILSQNPELVELRKKLRFEKKQQHHRDVICQAIQDAPECTRGLLQSQHRTSYTWLFRYDKKWLYKNLPEAIVRQKRYLRPK